MPEQVYTLDKYEVQQPSHLPCRQSSYHPHFPDGETEAQCHVPNAPGSGHGSADGTGWGGPQGRVTPSTTCGSCAVGGRQAVLPQPRHREEPHAEKTQDTASAQATRMHTVSEKCPETDGRARRAGGSGRGDRPPGHHPRPCPRAPTTAASPAHLDAVLLKVQVPRVDGDAGWDFGQLSPGADHPTGLVAAGAGRWAGGGRRGAPSGGGCHSHAAPAGPQGRGEEPEEQQGPMGPGHPTGRQRGAQGAAGARHPQCSCSAWAPGGCRERREEEAQ